MGSCLSHDESPRHSTVTIQSDQPPKKIQLKLKTPVNTTDDDYHSHDLLTQSFETLQKFTFAGIVTKAKVVDVYDGDTVTIVFYHNNQPIKDSFRMLGYDAPEMKPRLNVPNRELHMQAARVAREKLLSHVTGKLVWVRFTEEEKYGRLMGEMFHISSKSEDKFLGNEQNINDWMIKEGYGKAYDGGHKSEFTKTDLQKIINK